MALDGSVSGGIPTDWVPITASATALARPVRAIRANVAGTVIVTVDSGASRTLNFAAGETRLIYVTHVTGGTATGLEGAV